MYLRLFTLFTFLVVPALLASQDGILRLAAQQMGVDTQRRLVVINPEGEVAGPISGVTTDSFSFSLNVPQETLEYDTAYMVLSADNDLFALYLTDLPLIRIAVDEKIASETKVAATLTYADDEQIVSSAIGIEFRGKFSLTFPKKSYDIEFRDSLGSEESRDVQFGNLREDDDWVLDALYNEPLRVNSFVAHKLWLDLHEPYYRLEEPNARSGADAVYTEVFLNGDYRGVYMLLEQVDRKQLKLKKYRDGEVRGELYSGIEMTPATLFRDWPPLRVGFNGDYAGWEAKYPDRDDTLDYTSLHELTGFIDTADDQTFTNEIADRFALDNVRDFFLFLNVASLSDNNARNAYLARYRAGAPYFYAPWDLDAAFGNTPRGEREEETDMWITNGLQERLIDMGSNRYRSSICERYERLREDLFAVDSLIDRIGTRMDYLKRNGVYAREAIWWDKTLDVSQEQTDFTFQFIRERMAYLDAGICGFLTPVAETGPVKEQLMVFPNPVRGRLQLRMPQSSVGDSPPYAVYGMEGRRVLGGSVQAEASSIDVGGLPPGLYLLRVGEYTARVVVAR